MARRNNNAFEKRMREQAKRERQEAKKQRKAERDAAAEEGEDADAQPQEDQQQLMAELAELHRRYDDEEISLEELEEKRAEITERMTIT